MTTYYSRDTNSDLSDANSFSYVLSQTAGAPNTLTGFSVSKTANTYADLYTPAGDPSSGGSSSGSWSFEINIVTAVNTIELVPLLYRINSSGTIQSGPIPATPANLTAGVMTFGWTDPALGTFATGDRVRVSLSFFNGTHSNETIDIGFNDADSEFITPYTLAGPFTYSQAVII